MKDCRGDSTAQGMISPSLISVIDLLKAHALKILNFH